MTARDDYAASLTAEKRRAVADIVAIGVSSTTSAQGRSWLRQNGLILPVDAAGTEPQALIRALRTVRGPMSESGHEIRPVVFLVTTVREAAQTLLVDPRTVARWAESGDLGGRKAGGTHWLLPQSEIERRMKR